MDTHILVEAISPVRNGGRTPAAPGDRLLMAPADARALERLGAVRVLDGDVQQDSSPLDRVGVYYYDLTGALQYLGEFARLDDAPAAFAPISAQMDAEAKEIVDRVALAERLAEERAAEIERLTALLKLAQPSGEAAIDPAAPPMEAAAVPEPVTPTAPKPVSVDMLRDELRHIASDEGIAWDSNDTKAELVQKIEAGRLTARGAA